MRANCTLRLGRIGILGDRSNDDRRERVVRDEKPTPFITGRRYGAIDGLCIEFYEGSEIETRAIDGGILNAFLDRIVAGTYDWRSYRVNVETKSRIVRDLSYALRNPRRFLSSR